jgi:hypothetical protein
MDNQIVKISSMKNSCIKKLNVFYIKLNRYHAVVPIIAAAFAIIIFFMPTTKILEGGANLRTLRVVDYPIVLVLEQNKGTILSAWLRTPAGAMEIEQVEGMSYIADSVFLSQVDQDSKDDVMWRTSYTNFEGNGIHLWIGMTTWLPKVYILDTPYQYTRWDAVPAKLVVPKGTAIYISPATPAYNKTDTYSGRDSYSFVYTLRMTPEGPSFVPVPDVYRQLSILLRAGIQGEFSPTKRLAYVRMLNEFNSLAEGNPPQAETLLNLQFEKIATLSWKR